jgi:hypothetical protein
MQRDHPHLRSAAATPDMDHFAAAVLQGLARPVHRKLSWSAPRTMVLGVLSFGLLPIVFLSKRFRQYQIVEQQQLWHLAEWLRQNTNHPEARALEDEAEALAPSPRVGLFASLCIVGLILLFFTQLREGDAWAWMAMFDRTYLYPFHRLAHITYYRSDSSRAFLFFNTWTLALTAIYLGHWLRVQLHARRLRAWMERFNRIATAEGLAGVQPRMPGIGLRPIWVAGGLVLAACGWLWAVPMILAGAVHRRMVHAASTANRGAIAGRFRDIVLSRRPGQVLPMPVYFRNFCVNRFCLAPVAVQAAYCSRCGSKVAAAHFELS